MDYVPKSDLFEENYHSNHVDSIETLLFLILW